MKENFTWKKEEGTGYIVIICRNCAKSYVWKPYKPKRWKGKAVKDVGELECPDWDLYSDPYPCKECVGFRDLWFWTHDQPY